MDNLKLLKNVRNRNELDAWESFYINKNRSNLVNIEAEPIISALFNI